VLAHATGPDGHRLVPSAHPERWWGLLDPTSSHVPVRPDDEPLAFSGSQLSEMTRCPLKWFLGHEVHAEVARTTALGFGSIVHVIADAVARDELPADPVVLDDRIDQVWAELGFEAVWQSRAERVAASDSVRRFLTWHTARPERTFVASELSFDVTVDVGELGVRLRGSFDRVEVDSDGAVRIADLKTTKSKLPSHDLPEHPQMGVYQVAVREGALDTVADEARVEVGLPAAGVAPPVGGAELVLLRLGRGDAPDVQAQVPIGEGVTWVDVALTGVDAAVRSETFPARPGDSCRFCSFRRACPASDEGREVLP
jgi:RecB family exonuclease